MFTVEPFSWYFPAKSKGAARARSDADISLVFSTYFPSTAHMVASHISKRARLPWVAEFRDPWSQNPYDHVTGHHLFDAIARHAERSTLRNSNLLIAVSEPLKRQLEDLHRKEVSLKPSGFDPDDYAGFVPLTRDFTLTYTGNLYAGKRDPSELFKALRLLIEEDPTLLRDFQVRFVGGNSCYVLGPLVHDWGVENVVRFYPQVPFRESIRIQRESTALLLLSWNDPRDAGTYTGKVFQYLGAGRPILGTSVYESGRIAHLLEETGCGVVANDAATIKTILHTWILEFKEKRRIESFFAPNAAVLELYTWENQARKVAAAFDHALAKSRNRASARHTV